MFNKSGVRLSLIHALPTVAAASGVNLEALLKHGGLAADAFRSRDQVVRRSQVVAIMNGLARKSGDAGIGFRMAGLTRPDLLGPFGRSLTVGRTVAEALALQQRHMAWFQRGTLITMETVGSRFQWTHRMSDCDPVEARFLTEGIASFFVRIVRAASGNPDSRVHVVLPHRPTMPLSRYEDALQCAVSFDPGSDLAVRFDAALLNLGNALRSAEDAPIVLTTDGMVPKSLDLSDEVLVDSLIRMVEVSALWGRLTLEDAAMTVGMAPRSLQRRLARCGIRFEGLVDSWRHGRAVELLSAPTGSTALIAAELGYADPSHFIRAFRRWEGMAPMEYQRERSAAGPSGSGHRDLA